MVQQARSAYSLAKNMCGTHQSRDHGIGDRSAAKPLARPILRHCVREIREGRPNRRIFCARIVKTIDHLADARAISAGRVKPSRMP